MYADFPIELATIPILLGVIIPLLDSGVWDGDIDDIEATIDAFRQLMLRLSQ